MWPWVVTGKLEMGATRYIFFEAHPWFLRRSYPGKDAEERDERYHVVEIISDQCHLLKERYMNEGARDSD